MARAGTLLIFIKGTLLLIKLGYDIVLNDMMGKRMKYQFGDKLREVRQRAGMTMKEVADLAGVSESLISQIERNHVSPAIDTLVDIAEILHIDMNYLFRDLQKAPEVNVVRKKERHKIMKDGVVFERLSRMADKSDEEHGIEAYYMEIAPGAESSSEVYGHKGKELGTIIAGNGVLSIGGQSIKLKEGDSVSFASDCPHKLKNDGSNPLRTFWVITPPKMFK